MRENDEEFTFNRIIGDPIIVNGIAYRAILFDMKNAHSEPCGSCSFGSGTYTNPICIKPIELKQSCTCINRSDGKNVFFRKEKTSYIRTPIMSHRGRRNNNFHLRKKRLHKIIRTVK